MRHSLFFFAAFAACVIGAMPGCGNGDDDDLGSSSSSSGANGSSSSGASSQDAGSDAAAASTLTVVVGGDSHSLVLADVPASTFKDVPVATLPAIWEAVGTGADYNDYTFDFVGADGFRPSSRDKCKGVVFDGPTFAKGYVETDSQRLTWDDDLGFSGCAYVNGLVSIEATKK